MRAAPLERLDVRRVPADWNLRDLAWGNSRSLECVLIGPCRHSGNTTGRPQHSRFETFRECPRRSTLRVNGAAIATTHLFAPGTNPRILVVEDEWHAEPALDHWTKHRRIGRIDRDEHRIEGMCCLKLPRGAAKAGSARSPRSPLRDDV